MTFDLYEREKKVLITTPIPSSPYFLSSSDNPGNLLVLQPLNGKNYSTWQRSMRMALSAKNKLGFINGTLSKAQSLASSVVV